MLSISTYDYQAIFAVDDVEKTIHEVIETTLGQNLYNENMVSTWQNTICEKIMGSLAGECKNMKYMGTSLIRLSLI